MIGLLPPATLVDWQEVSEKGRNRGHIKGMQQKRVLIVDDEEETLELYRRFLKDEGYEIVTECSPQRAIERLTEGTWDLLITDIYMPGTDGFELMQQALETIPALRCIAVTGYGTEKVLADVLEFDCFGYINKPFDWEYLKLLIRKALKPASTRGPSPRQRKKDK